MPDLLTLANEYRQSLSAALTDEEKENVSAEYNRQREIVPARLEEFYASDAGREYQLAQRRYALNFSQDGSLRLKAPGRYGASSQGDDNVSPTG